jgi:hypothetical protein
MMKRLVIQKNGNEKWSIRKYVPENIEMPLEFVYKKQKKKLEEMARGSLERCK